MSNRAMAPRPTDISAKESRDGASAFSSQLKSQTAPTPSTSSLPSGDKEQAAGRPLGEATGRLTSLEERCGQGGSLAVADRCDNHRRQREGSVERHEAARRSAKSFALASSKE